MPSTFRDQLRSPAPTLEPDAAFLDRLSALAVSGASEPIAEPRRATTGAVLLAAASVVLLVTGIAWLSGLGGSDAPDPSPQPTTPVSRSVDLAPTRSARPATPPAQRRDRGSDHAGASSRRSRMPSAGATDGQGQIGGLLPSVPAGVDSPSVPSASSSPRGPDEHAGDHPNAHATHRARKATKRKKPKSTATRERRDDAGGVDRAQGGSSRP